MTNIEIVPQFKEAFEDANRQKFEQILADDYVFDHGGQEGTSSKQEFIDMVVKIAKGVPDLTFHLRKLKEGETVEGEARLEGTHTHTLDLTGLGLDKIEATNQKLHMAWEPCNWTIDHGKITRHEVESVPAGGVPGLLKSIGVEVPAKV